MNSCILITSHLNTDIKHNIALDLVKYLSFNTDLPIIFVGNFPIDKTIQEHTEYTLYLKNNPTTRYKREITWNNNTSWDYAYAHQVQMIEGFNICKSKGYDYVYHFNYDVSLDKNNLHKFLYEGKEGKFIYFPWGPDAISTALYSIKTEEFLRAIPPNHHYYYNENPPGINENWFGEVFFKWAFLYSNVYDSLKNFSTVKYDMLSNHL